MSDAAARHRRLRDALPGLLHPGLGGWEVAGDALTHGFRLRRRDGGALDIKALHLREAAPAVVGDIVVEGDPRWDPGLANGVRIDAPGAELRIGFQRPGEAGLWLLAQPGERALACYDLRIDVLGEGGGTLASLGSDDPAVLAGRLEHWRARAERLPEAAAEIEAVLAQATSALADEAGLNRGPDARLAALNCVVALAAGREGGDLRDYLDRAAGVIPALIDKAEPATGPEIKALHQAATALMFAHVLVNRTGEVRRPMLSEFGLVLNTPEARNWIETQVDRLHARAGGDPALRPILFRKHTLSGSRLRADRARHLDALAQVEQAVAATGRRAAIGYGTFLGAVRDGDFIAHDDDLDMLVELEVDADGAQAETLALAGSLADHGFEIRRFGESRQPVIQVRRGEGPWVDLFPTSRRGDGQIALYMHRLKLARLPRETVLPFAPIDFLGRRFLGPAQAEAFLEARYGADWRTPIRWTSRDGAG